MLKNNPKSKVNVFAKHQPIFKDGTFSPLIFAASFITLFLLTALFHLKLNDSAHARDTVPQILIGVFTLLTCIGFCYEAAKRGLTATAVMLFFFFCFYGQMPLLYFRSGYWLFGDISTDNRKGIIWTSILSYIFVLSCLLGAFIFNKFFWAKARLKFKNIATRNIVINRAIFIPIIQISSIIFVIVTLGPKTLLLRSGGDTPVEFESFWVVVILNYIRPLSFFAFCIFCAYNRGKWNMSSFMVAALLLAISMLGNFPTSLPRFYLFMLGVVFVYTVFYGTRYWKLSGLGFLLFGFFAGAITDQFRHMKSTGEFAQALNVDMQSYLTAGHFDGFEVNVYGVDFVDEYGVLKGRQGLGVLGFAVPRIFWNNKPKPTGVMLGEEFIGLMESTKNTNLSSPLPIEGYIDFGIAGVILHGLLFGIFIKFVDNGIRHYHQEASSLGFNSAFAIVVLPVFVGMTLFLLRGSLMPAFAYTLGSAFSAFTVFYVLTTRISWRNKLS